MILFIIKGYLVWNKKQVKKFLIQLNIGESVIVETAAR